MSMQTALQTLKASSRMTGLRVQKYSPEIMVFTGIASLVGATVLACNATLKSQEVMENHKLALDSIAGASNLPAETYSDQDRQKDLVIAYSRTAGSLAKNYGPALAMTALGIGFILGGQRVLQKRNIALVGAYKLIEKGWEDYSARVREDVGAEKEAAYRYGLQQKTTTKTAVNADGKKQKVKETTFALTPDMEYSGYAKLFEEQVFEHGGSWTGSSQFSPTHSYNYAYIVSKLDWFNTRLTAEGVVYLNDVYEELGFPRTAVGQQVGWVKANPDGDGYISFGSALDMVSYDDGDPILLDFNVDGYVLDMIA